jgi:trimeric autotransporter adhesin
MSTKTTFKRVALVAVASLGFGLLSVVPSNAAITVQTVVYTAPGSAGTTAATVAGVIGTPLVITVTNTITGVAGDIATDLPVLTGTAVTAGSAVTVANSTHASVSATNAATQVITAGSAAITVGVGNTTTVAVRTLTFTPDLAGTYVFTSAVAGTVITAGAITVTVASTGPVITSTGGTSNVPGVAASVSGVGNGATFITLRVQANALDTAYVVTTSGVGSLFGTTPNVAGIAAGSTVVLNTAGTIAGGFAVPKGAVLPSVTQFVVADAFTFNAISSVAGTQTVTVTPVGSTTPPSIMTITWGAAAVPAVSTTTARLNAAGGVVADGTDTPILVSRTLATQAANIIVTVRTASGAALIGQTVSATITGSGLIRAVDGAAAGTGIARATSVATTGSVASVHVSADGTAGVGTITILVGTTVVATKTVTFHGAVATLTATQGVGVMRSGRTAASTDASVTLGGVDPARTTALAIGQDTATNISIVAKDADGNVVPLATNPTAVISDAAVISAVNIASCTGGVALTVCAAGAGNYIANTVSAVGGVSGASATVTFRTPHPTVAGTFISTAALPFTLGGTKTGGTVTMTLDKTTYEPGEKMVITYTAKDAAGNPVHDWATVGAPSSNKNIVGLNTAGVYVAGKHIYGDEAGELTYAPVTPGAFIVTLATGTSTTASITATATVGDDAATASSAAAADAAAEATDAANAATDAANAAAEAADAATAAAQDAADAVAALSTSVTAMVADLRKQITSLTNLVIKIQKKVKA